MKSVSSLHASQPSVRHDHRRLKMFVLVGACVCVAVFAARANLGELGIAGARDAFEFVADPSHDTALWGQENVRVARENFYYVRPGTAGWLLYKLSARYSVEYVQVAAVGWNNGAVRVSWSVDGRTFHDAEWRPVRTAFKDRFTIHLPRPVPTVYLRVDLDGAPAAGQTNLHSLAAFLALRRPFSWALASWAIVLALAVLLEWLLYSRFVSRLGAVDQVTARLDDAAAHGPLWALAFVGPLRHAAGGNVTASLLVYVGVAFLMVRAYQLVRRTDGLGAARTTGFVLVGVLVVSSVLYLRMITGDGDGTAYYALPRSLVVDRDLDFLNEFTHANTVVGIGMPIEIIPQTGKARYPYPVGTGLGQLPFVVAADAATVAARRMGLPLERDGYSPLYSAMVAAGSVLCSFFALCLAVRMLTAVAGRPIALLGALTVWFATSSFSMTYLHPSNSHGVDLAVVGVFFYAWFSYRQTVHARSWFVLGVLLGACVLVRSQNLVLGLMLCFDALVFWETSWRRTTVWRLAADTLRAGAAGVGGLALATVPQLAFTKAQSGSWWYSVYSKIPIAWFHPKLGAVLAGGEHGLVYWTPIVALGLVGLGLMLWQDWRRWGGLVLVVAGTIYQIAAFGLFGGAGAGMRYFINMSLPLAAGTAFTLRALSAKIGFRWSALICGLGVFFNLWLLSAYAMGVIPEMGRGVTLRSFVRAVVVEGPRRTPDFLEGVTYFNKPAPAIGSTLYHRAVRGTGDPGSEAAALLALATVVFGGWGLQRLVLLLPASVEGGTAE